MGLGCVGSAHDCFQLVIQMDLTARIGGVYCLDWSKTKHKKCHNHKLPYANVCQVFFIGFETHAAFSNISTASNIACLTDYVPPPFSSLSSLRSSEVFRWGSRCILAHFCGGSAWTSASYSCGRSLSTLRRCCPWSYII